MTEDEMKRVAAVQAKLSEAAVAFRKGGVDGLAAGFACFCEAGVELLDAYLEDMKAGRDAGR